MLKSSRKSWVAITLALSSLVICSRVGFKALTFAIVIPAILAIGLAIIDLLDPRTRQVKAWTTQHLLSGMAILLGIVQVVISTFVLPNVVSAVDRTYTRGYLKQIGLGLKNYHDLYGSFPPPAVYDDRGTPLLSWRVLILPFMEHPDLFERFNLGESWDGPTNGPLLANIPYFFKHVGQSDPYDYTTYFQAVVGMGAAFEDDRTIAIDDFRDGIGHTALVIEALAPVPWTSPYDIRYRQSNELPCFGLLRNDGFHILWALGSVDYVDKKTDKTTIRSWITRGGGESWQAPIELTNLR